MTTRAQTAQHKKAFLEAFAEYGNVSRAALVANVERRTIYKWLEHDDTFILEYRQAEMQAEDVLEHAGWKRAVEGVEQTHGIFHQGQQVATETKVEYSDTLLMFLLKARNPKKYRDRVSIDYGDVPTDKLLAEAVALGLVTAGDRPA
ncbi:MAG TPA: hypothetical protein VGP33_16925 [Chloroflexota bacterium]|nr:hypothetical protein [Chloroflexota bacterium]